MGKRDGRAAILVKVCVGVVGHCLCSVSGRWSEEEFTLEEACWFSRHDCFYRRVLPSPVGSFPHQVTRLPSEAFLLQSA